MRVAVVCPYDLGRPGGVQHQAISLVGWLRDADHDAWLVGPGEGGPPGTRSVGTPFVVPVSGTRAPLGVGRGLRKAVAEAVAGADVVHVHEPLMPFVSLAALRADTPPKIGTFHADPPQWATTGYRLAAPVLRRTLGRLARATAVSPVAARGLEGIVETAIVPNGVDTGSLRVDVPRQRHRVAFVGRDEPRKGLDVLLAAWPAVRREVPDAELVAVGPVRSDPPEGVVFRGRVDDGEKAAILSSATVLCAPNLSGESFGIVLVEGMAAGCAVVASGLPAFVAVGADAARYAAPGDVDGLARILTGLLCDDEQLAASQRAGALRATTFDRAAVLEGYLEEYRRAVSG